MDQSDRKETEQFSSCFCFGTGTLSLPDYFQAPHIHTADCGGLPAANFRQTSPGYSPCISRRNKRYPIAYGSLL